MRDFSWLNWRVSIYLAVIFILSSFFMDKKNHFQLDKDQNTKEQTLQRGNVLKVFSGDYYNCVLTLENKAFCWGFNPTISFLSSPKIFPVEIANSLYSKYYLNKGGLYALNKNDLSKIEKNSGIIFKEAYFRKSYYCGLTPQHDLYCWGHYLNKPDLEKIERPQPIFIYLNLPMQDLKFKSIAMGLNHICAITIYSDLFCWGDNALGQLGVIIPKYSDEPLSVNFKEY